MTELNEKQERMWGMLCHLTALTAFAGIPFGHLLGPLVVWLMKKNESPFVDEQGKESLNFQISMTIYLIISGILTFVFIGVIFVGILVITELVLVITASVKINNGESFQYPLNLHFIK